LHHHGFKQITTANELDLKNVILLDSQSTLDLFCNKNLVISIIKAPKPMHLQSNGGSMKMGQELQATIMTSGSAPRP